MRSVGRKRKRPNDLLKSPIQSLWVFICSDLPRDIQKALVLGGIVGDHARRFSRRRFVCWHRELPWLIDYKRRSGWCPETKDQSQRSGSYASFPYDSPRRSIASVASLR